MDGPENFMVDNSRAEIKALSAVYPNSAVLLCQFHVTKFVEEWMAGKKVPKVKQLNKMFIGVMMAKDEETYTARLLIKVYKTFVILCDI